MTILKLLKKIKMKNPLRKLKIKRKKKIQKRKK